MGPGGLVMLIWRARNLKPVPPSIENGEKACRHKWVVNMSKGALMRTGPDEYGNVVPVGRGEAT